MVKKKEKTLFLSSIIENNVFLLCNSQNKLFLNTSVFSTLGATLRVLKNAKEKTMEQKNA